MPSTFTTSWTATRVDPLYRPDLALAIDIAIPISTTIPKGTVMGELTASPGVFKAYASGNVDGSQVARGILVYTVTSDASGNITIEGEFGQTYKTCPVWVKGIFACSDLVGLDAAGLTNMGGALVRGPITVGAGAVGIVKI